MLNVDIYLSDLERAAGNLPAVIARWGSMSEEARAGFADQLCLMLLREGEALVLSRGDSDSWEVGSRLALLNTSIGVYAADLERLMGIRVQDLIVPPSTAMTVQYDGGTLVVGTPEMEWPRALAA